MDFGDLVIRGSGGEEGPIYKFTKGVLQGVGALPQENTTTIFDEIPLVYTGTNKEILNTPEQQKAREKYYDLRKAAIVNNTSVTLDKKTGDIMIKAPSSILESDWFKKNYSENQNLLKLSQAYKLNPDYAYETTDENGTTIYKKAEQLIADYNEGLRKSAEEVATIYSERDKLLRPLYGDKVDKMSIEDIRTALTPTYNVGDIKVTNSTVISLPDFLLNHPIFGAQIKKLASFDKETGTVTRGDFIENFWNRDKNPELTAERIQELYQNLGVTLEYSTWDNVSDDNYERHGSNQAAREIAFRNFIQGQDPEAGFWLQAGDRLTGAIGGLGMGLADWALGIMNAAEWFGNVLTFWDGEDQHGVQQMAQDWNEWKEYNNEQLQLISDTSAAWTGFAEFVAEIGMNIYTGNLAGEVVAAGLGVAGASAMNLFKIQKSSSLGKTISAFVLALDNTQEAGKIIKASIGAQKIMARGGALAGSIVNITTQAIVDAALTDPVLFRKAIEGDGGDEAYQYLSSQYAWNVLGFGMGLTMGKVAMKAGNTKFGRAVNAKIAQGNAKLKTKGYAISDAIKSKILNRSLEDTIAENAEAAAKKGKKAKGYYDIQKNYTKKQLRTLREETEAFAKADLDIFDGWKINEDMLEEAENYIVSIKNLQNAIDIENRSLRLFVDGYDDVIANPEMAGINKVMKTDLDDIIARENEIVHSTGAKFTRMEGSPFSQESANYIGAKVELNYMESVLSNPKHFSDQAIESATKNIDSYREYIASFTEKATPEYVNALDQYVADGRRWYESMNAYRVSRGISNAQDLEDLLENPMFNQGSYMRVQRVKDHRYTTTILADGTKHTNLNLDFQHLEFAPMSDFMAPDTVQSMYKFNTAKAERNLSVLKMRLSAKSATKDILVSGEETQFAKDFKTSKVSANNAAAEQVKKFTSDNTLFDAATIKADYQDVVARAKKEAKLTADIKQTEKGIEKTATKTYRVNDAQRMAAANALAPTDVTDMLVSSGKSQTGSILRDGLNQYADDAAGFNQWYKGLPDESKKTINKIRRDYNEYIGAMPNDAKPLTFQQWFGGETGEATLEEVVVYGGQTSDDFFGMLSESDAARIQKEIGQQVDPALERVGLSSKNQLPKLNRQQYYEDTMGKLSSQGGSMSYKDVPKEMRSHLVTSGRGAESGAINNDEVLRNLFHDNSSDISELYEKYEQLASGPAKGEFTEEKFTDWITYLSNDESAAIEAQIANKLNMDAGLVGADEGARLGRISRDNLETLIGVDPNLEDTINLQALKADKDLLKSERITKMAEENKRVNDNFIRRNVLAEQRAELVKTVGERSADEFVDNIVDFADKSIDNFVEQLRNDPKTQKFIRTIAEQTGDSEDDVLRYFALTTLEKNQSEINKQIKAAFGTADKEMAHIGTQVENAFDSMLESYVDSMLLTMSDSDLVSGEIFDRVSKLNAEISEASAAAADDFSNVIATTDAQGRKVFMQVDPVTASLFKTDIDYLQKPTNIIDKTNKLLSKTFRLGTTGVNLSSTMRQWFRDSGNAFSMGGAFRKIQSCSDELVEDWGERIVQELNDYDLGQLSKLAEETGTDIRKLAVERELRLGQIAAGQTTEAELFTESLSKVDKMKSAADKAYTKIEDIMNNSREHYLRNRVYANNLLDAMNNGKTLEQARIIAEFAMNNATTNFSRKLVHLQRIADSTPYLSAAINGTKSFWRMVTLDPVGITTRIMAGFVVPQMYLTVSSLADEKDREVYKNMAEYTKTENMVFVHNGIPFTIPIPQELSIIVDPFRQFVETLYGVNKYSFMELAANDILGAMPLDMSGFSAVDIDDMISDPTIFDRIGRGVSKVFSQVAPIPIKSAYMVATGIDPYSGKKLRDKSWVVWNDDIGDYETMDYNQSSFTKLVASCFGDNGNATLTGKVLSGVFGNTVMDVIDTVVSSFQRFALGDETADPTQGLQNQLGRIGDSLTGEDYSTLNSEWQRAIAELEEERDSIIRSKEMRDIQTKLGQDIDDDTRQKLIAKRKDLLADWQKRVGSTVSRLSAQGGTFDRYKFGAVVQLLNMNSIDGWVPDNKYLQQLNSQNYYAGRNEAYRTLRELGIEGASDYSIFGYYKRKGDETSIVYNTPTSIITAGNLLSNASNVNKANIEAIIKKEDMYTQRQQLKAQEEAIYAKGRLKNSDYNQIDAARMAFNNKVLAALMPYASKVSPEAITEDEQIMDVLENIIQVPTAYERIGNRFVSGGGGKLNKQQGFVRSYIKAILNKENM